MTQRRFLAPPAEPGLPPGPRPTFSVAVRAYQAAATIGVALESALGQSVPPYEIVVCDDGSSEPLEAALSPYRDRIIIVRQENRGPAAAMNTAVAHSTGDFVAMLDADDAFLPGRLEALGDLAVARPDLDLLATEAVFEREGTAVGRVYDVDPFPVDDQRRAIIDRCFLLHPAVRRSRMVEAGGFDESLEPAEDWDCWLRLILGGSEAGLVDEVLHRYRFVAGSLTDDRPTSLRQRVRVLEKARSSLDLRAEERELIAERLPLLRRRALLAEARKAIAEKAPDARRRSLAVVFGPRMATTTRLKAAIASISPSLAQRRVERRGSGDKGRFPEQQDGA